jgi:threonine/homoserine/homoserine lactone efflux protein
MLLGGVLAILAGPVFFLIMSISLRKGFKYAAYVATGVIISDTLFIFIAYFGSNFILLLNNHRFLAGIISGILLIGFGIALLLKKTDIPAEAITVQDKLTSPAIYIIKGFMINAMNPSVLFFWMGVAGTVSVKESYTITHLLVFYGSILLTIYSTDLLKAYIAHKLKSIITINILLWLNRISGFALISFGIYTLVSAIIQGVG